MPPLPGPIVDALLNVKNVIVINEKQYGKITNDRPVTEIFALSC